MTDEVANLIDDAADILEKNRWVQGEYRVIGFDDGIGEWVGHCAVGALRACVDDDMVVAWDDDTATPEYREALEAIASLVSSLPGNRTPPEYLVVHWNDDDPRTKQEVLDTFRLAAKKLRK